MMDIPFLLALWPSSSQLGLHHLYRFEPQSYVKTLQ